MVTRLVLVVAVLVALVPLTAFADEASEYTGVALTPDQAMVVQAESQVENATTPADKANATAIYELRMGAAMGSAEADLAEAQAMVTAHPDSAAAKLQLTNAQKNYEQLLELCGFTVTPPVAGPAVAAPEETFDIEGGPLATMPMRDVP